MVSRVLKYAAFPAALAAGMWVAMRDIHDQVYHAMKRYGVFNDILDKMEPLNDSNVQSRIAGTKDKAEFLKYSMFTKSGYTEKVTERMEHMGLGNKLTDYATKWRYTTEGGRRNAVINGLTVAGITVGAILSIAQLKSVQHLFRSKDRADSAER